MIGQENRSSENAAGCNTALVCTVRRLVIGNGCLAAHNADYLRAKKGINVSLVRVIVIVIRIREIIDGN